MGLADGYGVVIGTKQSYYRDPPDNFGRYYHGNLNVQTPTGIYHCAIDVDPKSMPDGVQWRLVNIPAGDFPTAIRALSDGWHPLASNSTSGALDYIRMPMLNPLRFILRWVTIPLPAGNPLVPFLRFLRLVRIYPPWTSGTGIQALTALEGIIENGKRFYLFGEPFARGGLGVHNIHQNQGDPVGGGHDLENAIWQDGGTLVEMADGSFVAFLNKFKTQSERTDDQGKPLP
ncbi:hypothetical protein FRC17_006383 [Serendipita sp. 399]|nr:hypothetical protein FRC17_006383 [Serendipita sp. 399]